MIKRRFLAYIYDSCLLTLVLLFTAFILPTSSRLDNLNEELNELKKDYLEEKIDEYEYMNRYSDISYEIDRENVPYSIINVIYVLVFFIFIPINNNGMTLGMSKFAIRIKKNKGKLTTNDLIVRNFIVNGLLYMLLVLLLLYALPKSIYFYGVTILGFLEFLLVIISAFMVLYRHDQRGLQDILTNTKIEEVK